MRKCNAMVLPLLCLSLLATTDIALSSSSKILKADPEVTIYSEHESGVPRFVSGLLSAPIKRGQEVTATLEFLREHQSEYRMKEPQRELVVNRVEEDEIGYTHVRLDQYYQGLKVYAGQLISHFDAEGVLRTVNGDYYADISIRTSPNIDISKALEIAEEDLASFFGAADLTEEDLLIFRWDEIDYLAWRFELFSESPMGRWEYFIDALTGDLIFKANRIMADSYEVGSGFGIMGDERTHLDTRLIDGTYSLIDYTRQSAIDIHGHGGQMPAGRYIRTYKAGASLPGITATDSDNIWDDYATQASAVDGHFFSGLMYDWMLRAFGRNSYDNAGASMKTSVGYYAEGDNNAYWNGSRIVTWTASPGYRELAGAPDVIAHEWGHAVTQYCSGLIYQKESGALNESFSDMMGAAFEFAHDSIDNPDWYMGENIGGSGTGFRNMADPHAKNDPDFYENDPYWQNVSGCSPSNSNDWCGVHTNSGVGNKWFYLLSVGGTHHDVTVTPLGVDTAILIAYRANRFYWSHSSDYADASYGTVAAALGLDPSGLWAESVEQAWTAVGVMVPQDGLAFSYPVGLPQVLEWNEVTRFDLRINRINYGTAVTKSAKIHYSIDGGEIITLPLVPITSYRYYVDLPVIPCGTSIDFSFTAEETNNGTYYDPDSGSVYTAFPATAIEEFFIEELWANPGWTTEGLWSYSAPVGSGGLDGGIDPVGAYSSGGNVFNYNKNGDYEDDLGEMNLTTTALDCSGRSDIILSFYRWLGIGDPIGDHASISISNNGTDWTLLWENDQEIYDGEWKLVELALGPTADNQPTVYLRWTMGPTNANWRSCGWNLDDFKLTSYLCIPWMCGDLTGDERVNLSDITRLIDFVYVSKEALNYERAGNVDSSPDGSINLSDITRLIDNVYVSHDPINCP